MSRDMQGIRTGHGWPRPMIPAVRPGSRPPRITEAVVAPHRRIRICRARLWTAAERPGWPRPYPRPASRGDRLKGYPRQDLRERGRQPPGDQVWTKTPIRFDHPSPARCRLWSKTWACFVQTWSIPGARCGGTAFPVSPAVQRPGVAGACRLSDARDVMWSATRPSRSMSGDAGLNSRFTASSGPGSDRASLTPTTTAPEASSSLASWIVIRLP